jgi:hypothetical protein
MRIEAMGLRTGPPRAGIAGHRFGNLIALERVGRTAARHSVWLCVCDCGVRVDVALPALRGGQVSCGCAFFSAVKPGERFGDLTVQEEISGGRWRCSCDCGGSVDYLGSQLRGGRRLSCGACVDNRAARGVAWCCGCKAELPLAAFWQRGDRPGTTYSNCRDCALASNARAYRADIDRSRAQRRAYLAKDPNASQRAMANAQRNPAKRAAQVAVYQAVRRGELVRPPVCSRCPETHRIEGHHDDYAKPLDVIWLCTACHRVRHKELRLAGIDPEASTRPERKVA